MGKILEPVRLLDKLEKEKWDLFSQKNPANKDRISEINKILEGLYAWALKDQLRDNLELPLNQS